MLWENSSVVAVVAAVVAHPELGGGDAEALAFPEIKCSPQAALDLSNYNYIYEGEFNDSKWHGNGTLKFPDGSTYIGEWKNNKMHGVGVFTWSDGKVKKGTWKDGDYVE